MPLTLLEDRGLLPLPADLHEVQGWAPNSPPQMTLLNCRAQLTLYGGASGGGKTISLVADSAQEYDNANFRGILLRKSFQEMTGIMDEMQKIYRPLGARPSDGGKIWKFPAGGIMRLGYLSADRDIENYTGKPISWLGIDEAQFQTEKRVRALFPWVALPPEYGLRNRIRLTANPSTPWLKKVFLNDQCPLCKPSKSVISGAVYSGSTWSNGDLVMKTTAFIPAKAKDNPMYGEEKIAALMSQSDDIQRKLLMGCWCHTEGAFLPFFNESYTIPYLEVGEQWWWQHFISMDYGFSNSAAATGLYAMNENGIIFKVLEDIQRKMYSEEYAHHIATKMILRQIGQQNRRVQVTAGYADSAMDAHTGNTGRSNLQIINDILNKFDVHLIGGAKAPQASAQLLAGKIKRREYVIASDTCPKTVECWLSRRADPDKPGEVLKVPGDELDDVKDTDLYGLNNYCQAHAKPQEVKTAERIAELKDKGVDQMSLQVIKTRMDREAAKTSGPVTFGRPTIGRAIVRR